ncbi:MAG: hypothetical protein ACT4QE_19070 [Anaerolineales bacterium]
MLPDYHVLQRDVLLEVARAITEELDLNRVLRRILNTAVSLVEGYAVTPEVAFWGIAYARCRLLACASRGSTR